MDHALSHRVRFAATAILPHRRRRRDGQRSLWCCMYVWPRSSGSVYKDGMDFLFESWPHGAGPQLIQLAMLAVGAIAGVKIVDDVRGAADAVRRRKERQPQP